MRARVRLDVKRWQAGEKKRTLDEDEVTVGRDGLKVLVRRDRGQLLQRDRGQLQEEAERAF